MRNKATPPKVLRSDIDRTVLTEAFKWLRKRSHLTQKTISKRAASYKNFGRLLESQISDFERGRTLPALGSLVNILSACSPDGKTLDFNLLQEALIAVTVGGQSGEDGFQSSERAMVANTQEKDHRVDDLKGEFEALRHELAALRHVISATTAAAGLQGQSSAPTRSQGS